MMERSDMIIPTPVALPGEKVEVLNYRKKPGAWEMGICTGVKYESSMPLPKWRWSYSVVLDRAAKSIRLCVGDDGIRRGIFRDTGA